MFFESSIVALALTKVVLGLPQSNVGSNLAASGSLGSEITWDMKNIWSWGSPGGSGKGFDMSAPTNYFTGAPSFDVHCWRDTVESDDWKICTPRQNQDNPGSVSFRRLPRGREGLLEDMWVSHEYTSGGFTLNITGYALVDWDKDWKGNKKMSVVSKQVI